MPEKDDEEPIAMVRERDCDMEGLPADEAEKALILKDTEGHWSLKGAVVRLSTHPENPVWNRPSGGTDNSKATGA